MDKESQAGDIEGQYMTIEQVQAFFEPCGIPPIIIRQDVAELLKYRLVEPYDPTDMTVLDDQRIRMTHCGRIHSEFAGHWFCGRFSLFNLRTFDALYI